VDLLARPTGFEPVTLGLEMQRIHKAKKYFKIKMKVIKIYLIITVK